MGWFTTSIEATSKVAYDRTKSKLWPDGKQPDVEQQQSQLTDELSTEIDFTPEDRGIFDQMTPEQMGQWVADLPHHDRLDLLGTDEFIREYWPKARDGIENNDTLEKKFGLDEETEHTTIGQAGRICLHHEYSGAVEEDPYTPETTEKAGRSATRDESGALNVRPAGQGKLEKGTKEAETAKAERIEKWQWSVYVCRKDPDDCTTSLSEFFKEANKRHANVRVKSTSISDRLENAPSDYVDNASDEKESIDTELTDSTASDLSSTPETAADQNTDTPLHVDHTGGDIADDINDSDDVEKTDTTTNNTFTTDDNRSTSKADHTDHTDETDAGGDIADDIIDSDVEESTTTSSADTDATQSDTSSSTDETNQTDHTEETDEGGDIADDIKDKDDVDGFTPSSDSEQKRTDGDNTR